LVVVLSAGPAGFGLARVQRENQQTKQFQTTHEVLGMIQSDCLQDVASMVMMSLQ
jgi:hypothetical protein